MAAKKGSLSISSENIFPIIKKWVYSDHDIFIREMISNGCDAITKLKKLDMMGEYQIPDDYKASIQVVVNPEEKTLKFIDTGLGMTADEVEEYITQIAFSGATQFLEKYKDKTTEDDMIGHFGLGFYSAFMVADEVHIDTLSYKDGATAVHWVSNGGTEYEMEDGTKEGVGTEITLYLNEDSIEFANEYRVREVLEKYCSFMPVEIFLSNANAEPEYETIDEADLKEDDEVIEHIHEDAKMEEKENENGEKEMVEVSPAKEKVKIKKRPVSISDVHPLWAKHPNECSDEDYQEFYRKVFLDYKEPLFWIHLNMDYPFNLKGILYFPRINTEYDSIEGTIKLYNNQVFIADNIKEVIPEFLMVLKGVIDCPDLPLNVSRSALQNDGFVTKIADYIAKKVSDKLSGMCKTKREEYEKYWDNISPFIKFGCLKDEKFCDKMKDAILFKNLDSKYLTLKDCIEENGGEIVEPNDHQGENAENPDDNKVEEIKTTIYYVTDEVQQSQYINLFRNQGKDAVILNHNIDSAFITQLEQRNPTVRFQRIDADVTGDVKEEISEEEKEAFKKTSDSLIEIFRKELGNDKLDVKIEKLKDESVASMITLSEQSRRMQEMMKMYGMAGMDMGMETALILNANHPLVQYVAEHQEDEHAGVICKQLYDLAMLAHKPLNPDEMTAFVKRSNEIMMLLTK
ncbi:MAG: molecular chaperone HtpG [Lachnospiraceae bacterium]|uniref:Molecular chaperone HtpG n=1 Tax=Dorea phocaeensis TaxID=2040291 RepID=A0A850HJD7_9FIRM|nr:molecular chaperone HtpG [Dorea phocaeensis]MBS5132486.1 molecular chaperone HtpG [Lachnospiraceae bacterium]NSK14393.1 molecular chaperone HtpG [Dorea phocaeensis]NVH58167.1 molecular chaperone HtpG [Dorea phocaeensis]